MIERRHLSAALFCCSLLGLVFACSKSDSGSDQDRSGEGGLGGDSASAGSQGETSGSGGKGGTAEGSGGRKSTSGEGGTTGSDEEPATFEDLPDEIQAYCERMEAYACEMFTKCQGWTTCDQHPVTYLHEFCHEELPKLWARGFYTFDAELAETCLPDPVVCVGRWADTFDTHACRDVFRGALAPGDACHRVGWIFGSPCEDGQCVMDGESCPGTCEAYAGEGESCATVSCAPGSRCKDGSCVQPPDWNEPCVDDCVGSLTCSDAGGDKVCQGTGLLGEACSETRSCAYNLTCKDGKCVDHVDLGDLCTTPAVCPSGANCYSLGSEDPATCNTVLVTGAPCENMSQCGSTDVECVDPDPTDDDFTRVCAPRSGSGDPCEPAGCRYPLWCQYSTEGSDPVGVCRLPGGIGDSCASGEGRFTGSVYPCLWDGETRLYCIEGTCRVAPQLSETCNPDEHEAHACAEGWCSFTSRVCESPSAEDEPCNLDAYDRACKEGTYCACENEPCDNESDSGICTKRKPNTALCNNGFECESGYCEGYRCVDAPLDCPFE